MSGHTPGPWTVTPDSFVMAGSRPSIGVARVITHAKEFVANARLIAAAPDLLDALKALVDWQGVEHEAVPVPDSGAEDCPGDDTCRCAIVAQVNAAIAKAEGR